MQKHFYSQLVQIDSLYAALDTLELSTEEKQELIVLAQDSLHHAILDAVLSELSEKDKKQFLSHIAAENHEEIWKLLDSNVHNVKDIIHQAAEELKKKLHADIEEAKRK